MKQRVRENVLIFYVGMFAAWSLWQIFLQPLVPLTGWGAAIHASLVKGVIWVCPMVLFWKKDGWKIAPKEMFRSPYPWLPCLAMLCVTAMFLHTVRIAAGRLNTVVFWQSIFLFASFSAGIIEEISFRGFLFNRQAASMGTLPAALWNGVLFALFHYPSLIVGQGLEQLISLRCLMLFAVGILFSLAFARWRNIWLTIVVHSAWNVLSYLWALT